MDYISDNEDTHWRVIEETTYEEHVEQHEEERVEYNADDEVSSQASSLSDSTPNHGHCPSCQSPLCIYCFGETCVDCGVCLDCGRLGPSAG